MFVTTVPATHTDSTMHAPKFWYKYFHCIGKYLIQLQVSSLSCHFCLQLSVKDPLKANANYRNYASVNGNPLYSIYQLMEISITIYSHYAHTVANYIIAKDLKKLNAILDGLPKFSHVLAAQHMRYIFSKK